MVMIEIICSLPQMLSERQRIEASPSPAADNTMPPPPSYDEVNGFSASQTYDGSTDSMGYFLGEVIAFFIFHFVTMIDEVCQPLYFYGSVCFHNGFFYFAAGYVSISRCV